jgi:hypothetical protein
MTMGLTGQAFVFGKRFQQKPLSRNAFVRQQWRCACGVRVRA